MKSTTLAGPALALLLTLAACGGGEAPAATTTPSTSATSTTTPTVTPTPTPTEISREDAAAQYLRLVQPYNTAAGHFKDVANGPWDQPAFSAASTQVAAANQAFLAALLAAEWPADVRPTVEKLVADSAGETTVNREMAAAKTEAEASAVIDNAPRSESGATAQLLRLKLGLDEVPVSAEAPTPSTTA